jgi:uncharacterized protein DUF5691
MTAWNDHVTAALLGTQRRPVPALSATTATPPSSPGDNAEPTQPDSTVQTGEAAQPRRAGDAARVTLSEAEEDPAGRLLDQAAVLTVRRRAGWRAVRGAEAIAPAPAESAPVVPPAAARRLAGILGGGDLARLLPEWLAAVAERGYRVPPRLLPELLDRGRGDRSLRPVIARAAGRRGAWLALRNTDWAYLITEGGDPGTGPQAWETGTRNQRIGYLTGLRATGPAAARAALAETWAREPAPERAAFLSTLTHGLSAEDEEFLESALDDRAKDVRQVAADLLARLPGSAYGRRMAERARGCLRASERTVRGRRQTWIIVEPPQGHDEEMARDGIPFHPAGSFAPDRRPDGGSRGPVGARAGWLREILARTPLQTWTEVFGRPPMEVVCLPVADGGRDVHVGWMRAALRQRDVEWARALLKVGVVDEAEGLADLLGVLPPGEREATAAALVRWVRGYHDLLRVLERIPGPWTGALADTVVGLLCAPEPLADDGPRRDYGLAQLCRLADERLTPDIASRLEAAVQEDSWPLRELIETLRTRHEMLEELT